MSVEEEIHTRNPARMHTVGRMIAPHFFYNYLSIWKPVEHVFSTGRGPALIADLFSRDGGP